MVTLFTVRVDGRDISVTGSLLQPLTRRTNEILRVVLSAAFLGIVITSSLITRNDWVALERSVSEIIGVLTPTQSTWCIWPTAWPSSRCRSSSWSS